MPKKLSVRYGKYNPEQYKEDREQAKVAEVGCVASHFLDSGSFSLWSIGKKWAAENNKTEWDFYNTPEFWAYMKSYVKFVKKFHYAIDYHANIDVIGNGELSWRNQQWLEKAGLNPVPVIHAGDPDKLKWLDHYLVKGYPFIGLGGLVGSMVKKSAKDWLDTAFSIICDTPDRLPRTKVHGFGVTQFNTLFRYPWFSVDSASWTKRAAFGWIIVPFLKGSDWDFTRPPETIKVSIEDGGKHGGRHIMNSHENSRKLQRVLRWLSEINVPFGEWRVVEEDGLHVAVIDAPGVCTRHWDRRTANLLYFNELVKHLPEYPQPFLARPRVSRTNFGFVT